MKEFVALVDVSLGGDPPAWEGRATVRFKFRPGESEITDAKCLLIDGSIPDAHEASMIEEEIYQNEALQKHLKETCS